MFVFFIQTKKKFFLSETTKIFWLHFFISESSSEKFLQKRHLQKFLVEKSNSPTGQKFRRNFKIWRFNVASDDRRRLISI